MFKKGEHEVICRPRLPSRVVPRFAPSLEYEWKVIKDGKVIDSGRGKSHSYVLNFMKMLRLTCISSSEDLVDVNGNTVTLGSGDFANTTVLAPVADDTYGILFGTSSEAFDINDNNLKSKIPQGTTDNTLDYDETVAGDIDTSETGKIKQPISRKADNAGGVSIDVYEIGLFIKVVKDSNIYYFMLARDVKTSPISVPSGATLSWTYYILTTY